jgi:hypothetical protein
MRQKRKLSQKYTTRKNSPKFPKKGRFLTATSEIYEKLRVSALKYYSKPAQRTGHPMNSQATQNLDCAPHTSEPKIKRVRVVFASRNGVFTRCLPAKVGRKA